jgi:hypothetical protein
LDIPVVSAWESNPRKASEVSSKRSLALPQLPSVFCLARSQTKASVKDAEIAASARKNRVIEITTKRQRFFFIFPLLTVCWTLRVSICP